MSKRVTIKDIAQQAGVSVGTVDRVIHERGRVSAEVKAKVLQVMQALDFEPNLIASTLAFNRAIQIGVLMPQLHSDPYWDLPLLGMRRAQQSVKHYGVGLVEQMFDLLQHVDILRAIKTAATVTLQRLDLGEFGFPEAQHMLRHIEDFSGFADSAECVG